MKRILKIIYTVFFIVILSSQAIGQFSFDIRLKNTTVDTAQNLVCYDLQLSNPGDSAWYLGNANILLFYDYSVLCIDPVRSSTLLDEIAYDVGNLATTSRKTPNSQFPLDYAETVGSVRLGIFSYDYGLLIDATHEWYSIINICFTIEAENITDPDVCFRANFVDAGIQALLPINDIIEAFNDDPTNNVLVERDTFYNVIPDNTKSTCFILEENSQALCSDGVDNDEDGLIDCADESACQPRTPTFEVTQAGGCTDQFGAFVVRGIGPSGNFSLDGGNSFQADSLFSGLNGGSYEVVVMMNDARICALSFAVEIPEMECREDNDMLCSDDIDNDNDGLIDCIDPDCQQSFQSVIITNADNCPDLNNGSFEFVDIPQGYTISIDSGRTFTDDFAHIDLSRDRFYVFFQNDFTGCISAFGDNPINIGEAVCPVEEGICNDGVDNDFDGLIDCADADCVDDDFCFREIPFYISNAFNPLSSQNGTFGLSASNQEIVEIRSFHIFDRWGNLLFERSNTNSADATHRWDGMSGGRLLSPGVYIYSFLVVNRGIVEPITGNVTLVY